MNKCYIKEADWEKLYTFLRTNSDIRVGNENSELKDPCLCSLCKLYLTGFKNPLKVEKIKSLANFRN